MVGEPKVVSQNSIFLGSSVPKLPDLYLGFPKYLFDIHFSPMGTVGSPFQRDHPESVLNSSSLISPAPLFTLQLVYLTVLIVLSCSSFSICLKSNAIECRLSPDPVPFNLVHSIQPYFL